MESLIASSLGSYGGADGGARVGEGTCAVEGGQEKEGLSKLPCTWSRCFISSSCPFVPEEKRKPRKARVELTLYLGSSLKVMG